MSRRGRMVLFVPAAILLAAGLVWAIAGLPDFGERITAYAQLIQEVAVPERHGTNVVTSIVFDYRGFDTLGEEFILFVAAVGCTMLLRAQRGEHAVEEASDRADEEGHAVARPVRALGAALVAPTLVLGAYIVVHGALTPGGGFQGGVVLAACAVLVYVGGRRLGRRRERTITGLELADALGAAGYALVATGGLVFGVAAAHNFLGYGITGSLWSAGTIPVLSLSVGVEVAGAITLIVAEFLDQALLRSDRAA